MLRIFVYLFVILKAADSKIFDDHSHYYRPKNPAATDAQIRFAEENNYDQTGPGAKNPETAYKTYKTLDEALIAYLDDPDTKLPAAEQYRAYQKLLYKTNHRDRQIYKPGKYSDIDGTKGSIISIIENNYNPFQRVGETKLRIKGQPHPFRLSKTLSTQNSVVHVLPDTVQEPTPKYSFSYGVHDGSTGDCKAAQEASRDGTVRGWYTLLQADGRRRTVHYQADDAQGFRATVHHDAIAPHTL